MVKDSWQVHKFGGSSLADPECFRRVGDILLDASPAPIAVVVSADAAYGDTTLTGVEIFAGVTTDLDTIRMPAAP